MGKGGVGWGRLDVWEGGAQNISKSPEIEQSYCRWVQVNAEDVYFMGGAPNDHIFVREDYDVPKSCFKVNVRTGEVQ